MFRFSLTQATPDRDSHPEPTAPQLGFPQAGALASFEGRVRNNNEGRSVLSLEYSAYPELAHSEGNKIMAEAAAKFDIIAATAVHWVGHLAIGDVAVRIEVYAGHRRAAFEACSWILDQIKARLPIWKKEWYAEGDSHWVACHHAHEHGHDHELPRLTENQFYDRQMRLEEWGSSGQDRLRRAKVLVIGGGGLGCPAALYLAGAGIGTLGICDGDVVSADNLHRQVLYAADQIGLPKAECAAQRLSQLNPFIKTIALPYKISQENAAKILADWDLVIEGSDSFATKFLVHDHCQTLGKPLVHASVYKHEIQLRAFPFGPTYAGPCLRCLYPQAPIDGCVGTCGEVGVSGPLTGMAGTFLASIGLSILLGQPSLEGGVGLYFDSRDFSSQKIRFPRSPECPLCAKGAGTKAGEHPHNHGLAAASNPQIPEQKHWNDLDPDEKQLVIDIREPEELQESDHDFLRSLGAGEVLHWPLSQWRLQAPVLQPGATVLIICAHGVRSLNLVRIINADQGRRFLSLVGGLAALRAAFPNQFSTI